MSEFIINSEQLERMIEAIEHDTSREVNRVIIEGERVPEIVRCRDCRFYDERHRECSMLRCEECWYLLHDVEPNGYCWRGERKVDA